MTKEELFYANKPAINAPYPGDDYAYETINKISYALIMFRMKYEGKYFNISLSNGENLNFEIKGCNLAHLLGIDYKMLCSKYMKPLIHNILDISDGYKINSLVILNRIIENADKVIANDEINPIKLLNYYKIMLKASSFIKFTGFDTFNFGVIDFNKKMYNNIVTKSTSSASTKYVFSKGDSKLIPYYMMGFKYDENFDIMVPETFIAPDNFSDYLYAQQLLLPLELSISNGYKSYENKATINDKIKILNFYKSLVEKYQTDTYINGFREVLNKTK